MLKDKPSGNCDLRGIFRFFLGWIGLVSLEILVYALLAVAFILAVYFKLL